MAIFHYDNVKIYQAQMKEWLWGSIKNWHINFWLSMQESRLCKVSSRTFRRLAM